MMPISIRPYQMSDFDAVYALWQRVFASTWPLSPEYLRRMTTGYVRYQDGNHLVALEDGQVVGFVSTQAEDDEGGIPLLMVSPDKQRQGIGTRLHTAAVERLQQKQVQRISLAHGGGDYFWPGVPLDCPGAVDFFRSCGWQFPDTAYDLVRDLVNYQTPAGVLERAAPHVDIRLAAQDEVAPILEFEQRVFPFWAKYYAMTADAGRYGDILAAWDGTQVVGTLLLEKVDFARFSPNGVWNQILGDHTGAIGAVGVADDHRERGIGIAMVAKASEILQARAVHNCVIGWTDLLSFYGRLGYTVWRGYAITD